MKALGRDKPCQCLMTSVTSTPLAFCACCMCVQFLFSLYNIHLSTNILHAHAYRYFMEYSISILTSIAPHACPLWNNWLSVFIASMYHMYEKMYRCMQCTIIILGWVPCSTSCNKKWNTKPAVYYIPLLVHRLEPIKLSIILAHKTTSSTVKASCLLPVVSAYKIVGMS